MTGNGIINFTNPGNIVGTLGVTGGNWNGAGSVGGLVTSSSGTFTIGSGANLTANGNLNVTGGNIAAGSGTSTITGSVNYTSSTSSTFGGGIAGSAKTLTLNNAAATLTLTGNNTYTGATTVSSGTLEVMNDSSTTGGRLSGTSSVTVNSGGTLRLSGAGSADRINDSAAVNLSGGTIAKGAGVNEGSTSAVGLGALTLTASSTLNYTSSNGTLTFASFSPGSFVLSISEYIGTGTPQGTDQLIFNQDQVSQLGSFNFGFGAGVNVSEFDLNNGFFEVYSTTPVPEPSTWVAGVLALAALGYSQRKRFAKKKLRRSVLTRA